MFLNSNQSILLAKSGKSWGTACPSFSCSKNFNFQKEVKEEMTGCIGRRGAVKFFNQALSEVCDSESYTCALSPFVTVDSINKVAARLGIVL